MSEFKFSFVQVFCTQPVISAKINKSVKDFDNLTDMLENRKKLQLMSTLFYVHIPKISCVDYSDFCEDSTSYQQHNYKKSNFL